MINLFMPNLDLTQTLIFDTLSPIISKGVNMNNTIQTTKSTQVTSTLLLSTLLLSL